MRKSTIILVTLVTLLATSLLSACKQASSSILEETVKEMQKECPMHVDDGIRVDNVYTEGNQMVIEYRFDDLNADDIQALADDPDAKQMFLDGFTSGDTSEEKVFLTILKESGYDVRCDLIGGLGGRASFTVDNANL